MKNVPAVKKHVCNCDLCAIDGVNQVCECKKCTQPPAPAPRPGGRSMGRIRRHNPDGTITNKATS